MSWRTVGSAQEACGWYYLRCIDSTIDFDGPLGMLEGV